MEQRDTWQAFVWLLSLTSRTAHHSVMPQHLTVASDMIVKGFQALLKADLESGGVQTSLRCLEKVMLCGDLLSDIMI